MIGVILGFAAQETLGSVIAGLILMFSRPFEIGDWIVVDQTTNYAKISLFAKIIY